MRLVVEAPAPTDLRIGIRRGTPVQWGAVTLPDGWEQDPQDPGNAGRWHWDPWEIANIDTFWSYIRDDLMHEFKPASEITPAVRSNVDLYQGAEGHVQLEERQLTLWAERPKKRMAMLLWG